MSEYDVRLYRLAEQKGWKLPSVNNPFTPESWNRYWADLERYEKELENGNADPGRPVLPHRSG